MSLISSRGFKQVLTQKHPLTMFQSNLPAKFFLLRKYLGYSQENVALEMGVSPEAYGKIERGKTNISEKRLLQISTIFGFEPWQMLQLSADELLVAIIQRKNVAPSRLNLEMIY